MAEALDAVGGCALADLAAMLHETHNEALSLMKSPHGPCASGSAVRSAPARDCADDGAFAAGMRDRWSVAAITNDIYTREDASP